MSKKNDRPRRRLTAPVAVAALATSGLVVLTSGAVFTDSATAGSNNFTSGTVDVTAGLTAFPVKAGNMAPGDTVNGQINVENTGSLTHRYAISATGSGDPAFANALQIVASVGGTQIYSGPLSGFQIGDPAQGAQAGDRQLTAGATEVIDLAVTLPFASGNALQGLTSGAALLFDAEQVDNN